MLDEEDVGACIIPIDEDDFTEEALTAGALEGARKWSYKYRYGLNIDTVRYAWKEQGGKCCICSRPIALGANLGMQVDHDHTTGRNRGLLCPRCNWLLGQVGDSVELLENAIRYLKEEAAFGKCSM